MAKKEIGYSGLNEWSGRIQEEFLTELRGQDGYKKYNEMRNNSPAVGAMLLAAEQSIRGVDWQYVSDVGEEDPRVEFAQDAMDGMSHNWGDHIIEALSMLPFGYAPFEIVWQRNESNQLVWRKFAIRGQDTVFRWLLDDNGGLEGMEQQGAPTYQIITIPIKKMVLYRTRSEKNNPEGRSMLRTAWIPYYYCKNIQQIEAIGIERDLAGLPVITPPMGATTDENDSASDVSKAEALVKRIRNDEQSGVVLPPPTGEGDHQKWHFTLASTGGSRIFDTDTIIKRYESRILMAALSQFLILGQDKVGTQALSSDMTDFFSMVVNAIADIIAETHTEYALKKLLRLNGMDDEGIRLEHSPAGDIDVAMLADLFQKVEDKITWLPTDELWLRSTIGLPDVDPQELEAEREKAKQEAKEMLPQQGPFGQPANQEMSVYAAGLSPDDETRRYYEERYKNLMTDFLRKQKGRVKREAKR